MKTNIIYHPEDKFNYYYRCATNKTTYNIKEFCTTKHGETANGFIILVLLSNSYEAPLSVLMVVLTLYNLDYLNI